MNTATMYALANGIGLIAIGSASSTTTNLPRLLTAGRLITSSVPLFSGSLVALALGAPSAVGMITPVGGLTMMGGWFIAAFLF